MFYIKHCPITKIGYNYYRLVSADTAPSVDEYVNMKQKVPCVDASKGGWLMMTVRTFDSSMEADRAVLMLKKAGVSAFTRELTQENVSLKNDGEVEKPGVQVRVVDDAAYKANQVLDVFA